ncbi:hypothetical protein AAMO2058_000059500 [Amorphochlora amoebiformis]
MSKRRADTQASGTSKKRKESLKDWALSSKRKVTINDFKNQMLVNIREYYTKNGKELPGSKGVALNPEQWKALCNVKGEISKAVEALDDSKGPWELPKRKRATVSKYKEMWLVDIRETYIKDGKTLPGRKGISLKAEQWGKLAKHMDDVSAALEDALDEQENQPIAPPKTKAKKVKGKMGDGDAEENSED